MTTLVIRRFRDGRIAGSRGALDVAGRCRLPLEAPAAAVRSRSRAVYCRAIGAGPRAGSSAGGERSVQILRVLAAGVVAGLAANATGYAITGRLFHRYQSLTPHTWRASESFAQYRDATLVRLGACVAIAFLYAALGGAAPSVDGAIAHGAAFGAMLWAATLLPLLLELALFVNWHRGFVLGILLDWLIVCLLASVAAAIAAGRA